MGIRLMLLLTSALISIKRKESELQESILQRKEQENLEEKELGIHATNWLKEKLESTLAGDDQLFIRTELVGGTGKYGRLLGWCYIGDSEVSLNEQMITEGYAWEYDGGTKQKNFEELREIRRSFGTLVE